MLHPIQPARLAFSPSGRRFSMADSEMKWRGIRSRFCTDQRGEYCITNRLGVRSDLIAPIIASYPASTIFVLLHPFPLFSSKRSAQLVQVKSQALVFGPHWLN